MPISQHLKTMNINYYQQHKFISNSTLTQFSGYLYGGFKVPNLQIAFDFGNLVDAMLTSPELIDFDENDLYCEDGRVIHFEQEDINRAQAMARSLQDDPIFAGIFPYMKKQHAFYRTNFQFDYDGLKFTLPMRCKMDGVKLGSMGADVKTTNTKSQHDFNHHMEILDYDRQGSLYMDMAKIDKMIYFAVSKKPDKRDTFKVFHFTIERGDRAYLRGRDKYNRLAFYYYTMIHNFNTKKLAT